MINNLSIKLYLNELKAKGGKSPIYLRITVSRKKSEVATGYYSEPKDWNVSSQEVWKNNKVNKALIDIKQEVHDIAQRLEKEKKPVTAHNIKNYLTKKDKLDAYLLDS